MKKIMPWLRVVFFCIALFASAFGALLLKEHRLFKKEGGETSGQKPPENAPPSNEPAAGGSGNEPRSDATAAKPSTAHAEPTRDQAVTAGRALFEVPEGISIVEASDLMNELKKQKIENDARKNALDQKEKELETIKQEIESSRIAVLKLSDQVKAAAPSTAAAAAKEDELDPETLKKLGKIVASMKGTSAATFLEKYPPDRAAEIILQMKEADASAVLSQLTGDQLVKVREALLRVKVKPASNE